MKCDVCNQSAAKQLVDERHKIMIYNITTNETAKKCKRYEDEYKKAIVNETFVG